MEALSRLGQRITENIQVRPHILATRFIQPYAFHLLLMMFYPLHSLTRSQMVSRTFATLYLRYSPCILFNRNKREI